LLCGDCFRCISVLHVLHCLFLSCEPSLSHFWCRAGLPWGRSAEERGVDWDGCGVLTWTRCCGSGSPASVPVFVLCYVYRYEIIYIPTRTFAHTHSQTTVEYLIRDQRHLTTVSQTSGFEKFTKPISPSVHSSIDIEQTKMTSTSHPCIHIFQQTIFAFLRRQIPKIIFHYAPTL
jgi:hypothetical protein